MADAIEIKYSMSELNDLVQRNDTCVTLQRKPRVLYLNPVQFSNIKSGIRGSLDSLLFKYDFFFKAIVLGYRKIKLLTRYGAFCYRSSKVSLQIEADFYLFNPEVGSKLQGVVCKRSGHHLGVLVHKAFTVFLPLNENNYETGWDYALGQEVEFEVESLDLTSGPLPYIKGKLIKEEKDGNEREGEGISVGADEERRYGNEWGGSDSGVASSTGRESEDSDDSERNDVSEGSIKKSTIEEWAYKRPHHRKSKGNFGDELMKVMERETASEDESGVYRGKSFERRDVCTTGEASSQELLFPQTPPKKRKSILKKKKVELLSESETSSKSIEACNISVTSSQESGSDFSSPTPVSKKRKSILKVHKDPLCDNEITNDCSAKASDASLLTMSQESAVEVTSISDSPKKRKSILKKSKEKLSSDDDKEEELKEKLGTTIAAEANKSPVKSKAVMSVPEIDEKSKSILRNIVGDLSPKKQYVGSVKSILETLERAESEKSFTEESKDSSKPVPMPENRVSVVSRKEVISSSDEEDIKVSEHKTVESETSTLGRFESRNVPSNDENANLSSEKQTGDSNVGKIKDTSEESDSSTKKKRKSLSKSKKRTSLLYESLAEKIMHTAEAIKEDNTVPSEEAQSTFIDPILKKVDIGKPNDSLKSAKKTSPEVKKKSPKKKGSPPAHEDLVQQLLKTMEMSIDGDDVDESIEGAEKMNDETSTIAEGKEMSDSKSPKGNAKGRSPKKSAGKRKSLGGKKGEPSLNMEGMIKSLTETTQLPIAKHGISPKEDEDDQLKTVKLSESPEVQKRQSLDGKSKDGSKKKSRKSVSNLTSEVKEEKNPSTADSLKEDDIVSFPATSTMEGNETESIIPSTLDNTESSIKTPKKQRQSVGEKKSKKQKSKMDKDPPQPEKEEAEIQIEKLLMMNKRLLGLDTIDASGDQLDKVSNEEKKTKKRKRESSGLKDNPKKRKSEVLNTEISNVTST